MIRHKLRILVYLQGNLSMYYYLKEDYW